MMKQAYPIGGVHKGRFATFCLLNKVTVDADCGDLQDANLPWKMITEKLWSGIRGTVMSHMH